MFQLLVPVAAIVLVANPSTAAVPDAANWEQAFPPAVVATHLPVGRTDIIVVGAGTGFPATGAVEAVQKALRGGGRAGLVMDAAALGDLSALDDSAIIKRCTTLPVKLIAVVRVFAGAVGEPPQAVVTLYAKNGDNAGAFTGIAGKDPAAIPAAESAGAGVSSAIIADVSAITRNSESDSEPQQQYDNEFIGFDELGVVAGGNVGVASLPYRGKYKKPLDIPSFYRLVGRVDLAKDYESSRTLGRTLLIGGGIAVVVGSIWTISQLAPQIDCESEREAEELSTAGCPSTTPGLVLSGIGLGAMAIGGLVLPNGPDAATAREMADKYNRQLKQRLQLARNDASEFRVVAQVPRGLRVLPFLARQGGGGLAIGGSF